MFYVSSFCQNIYCRCLKYSGVILLTVLCIVYFAVYYSFSPNSIKNKPKNEDIATKVDKISAIHRYNLLHNAYMELMRREKFVNRVYICPSGLKTIGYGHVLLDGEGFTADSRISEMDARLLMVADFDDKYNAMRRYKYLGEEVVIALSMCAYNVGQGRVCRMLGDRPSKWDVSKMLERLVYYDGIRSDGLYKARKRESIMLWVGM